MKVVVIQLVVTPIAGRIPDERAPRRIIGKNSFLRLLGNASHIARREKIFQSHSDPPRAFLDYCQFARLFGHG